MKIILAILFCAASLYTQEDTFWEYLAYPYGGTIEDLAIEQGDLSKPNEYGFVLS